MAVGLGNVGCLRLGALRPFIAILVPAFCGGHDVCLASSSPLQDRALQERLVTVNLDAHSALVRIRIAEIRAALSKEEEVARAAISAEIDKDLRKAKEILDDLIRSRSNQFEGVAARYRLALLLRESDAPAARTLLREAFSKAEQLMPPPAELLSSTALLLADLEWMGGSRERAEFAYDFVAKNRDLMPRVNVVRALLGLGDGAFAKFEFERASMYYQDALELALKSPQLGEQELDALLPGLNARLLWSSYRAGDMKGAVAHAEDFARSAADGLGLLSPSVMEEAVRVGGTALFELNDPKLFSEFSRAPDDKALTQRMVLYAFRLFVEAGNPELVDPLATGTLAEFRSSPLLLEFFRQWRVSLHAAGKSGRLLEVNLMAVELLRLGGAWRLRFPQPADQDALRAQIVTEAGLDAAERLLELARRTESRSAAAKALAAFSAVAEEPSLGRRRPEVLLTAGEAAWKAGDLSAALALTRQALQSRLPSASERRARHQLTAVTRQRCIGTRDKDILHEYLSAVDGFVDAYSEDPQARAALLESGRLLQSSGDSAEAVRRFERLLLKLQASQEAAGTFAEADEVLIAVRALLEAVFQGGDTLVVYQTMDRVEGVVSTGRFSKDVRSLIALSAATAVREHAAALRTRGRVLEAAQFLSQWSQSHPRNSEAPAVLRDAVREMAGNGRWKDVLALAEVSRTRFPKDVFSAEITYWKGRAQEAMLAFRAAAETYLSFATTTDQPADEEERRDALSRSRRIFTDLHDWSGAARSLEGLAALEAVHRSDDNAAQLLISAARMSLRGGKPKDALHFLSRARLSARVSRSTLADLDFCMASAQWAAGQSQQARQQAEDLQARLFRSLRAKSLALSEAEVLGEVLRFSAKVDRERVESLFSDIVSKSVSETVLGRLPILDSILADAERRAAIARHLGDRTLAPILDAELGRISSQAGDIFAWIGNSGSAPIHRAAVLTERAARMHAQAHRLLADAGARIPPGTPFQATIAQWLHRYAETRIDTALLLRFEVLDGLESPTWMRDLAEREERDWK